MLSTDITMKDEQKKTAKALFRSIRLYFIKLYYECRHIHFRADNKAVLWEKRQFKVGVSHFFFG